MKLWRSNEKGNDKIIAYANQSIYKVNPKENEVEDVVYNFNHQIFPSSNFMEIPLRYVKAIHMEQGKSYIEIFFGNDSTEHLRITDPSRKKEIFDFFKTNLPNSKSDTETYSKLKAGKKPLIAMIVIAALFLWTFYIATGIEHDIEYDVSGKQYHSMAGIVLVLASLGTTNVILIFGALFLIALISFIAKIKQPKVIHRIRIIR
ncbi:MAG: hypothetical protein QM802_12255 [Agriterribacter sp.]